MPRSWVSSLEEEARRLLPAVVYEYFRQGSRDSAAAEEAAGAWERHRLVPRVLRDVRAIDLATTALGTAFAAPFGAAPSTLQRAADPEGEVAVARACAAARVPMVVSSNASAPFAEIAETGVTWWLQAYLTEDRALSLPMLDSALSAGASAVVLTVDTPVVATKYDGGGVSALDQSPPEWVRANLGTAADAPKARDLSPRDIGWLHDRTGLPVVVKGVLHPQDARAVIDAGASAVWVSNHGGRQLARAAATADCLGAVADEVAGAVEVYVDGGVRDGIAALSALALGADLVFLGRLPLYALSVGGSDAVLRLFNDLSDELVEALRLSGCADPASARTLLRAPGE